MKSYDLFQKPNKERLYDFICAKKYAKTSECIRFASNNFSNRGDRDCRLLAQEGRIKRMDKDMKIRYFGNLKESVWIINNGLY